jgi:hypothetical protein
VAGGNIGKGRRWGSALSLGDGEDISLNARFRLHPFDECLVAQIDLLAHSGP